MNTIINQQNTQPNGTMSGVTGTLGNTSGASVPGNQTGGMISPEVFQLAYQQALSTLMNDANFARNIAAQIHVADSERKHQQDANELYEKAYGFANVRSDKFKKEWGVEKFTGCGIPPNSQLSQHFKAVDRSKTNLQILERDANYLQLSYVNIASKNVIWFDYTDGHLYIQTNDQNCSCKERERKLRNANTNTGVLNYGDIVLTLVNGEYIEARVETPGPQQSLIVTMRDNARMYADNNLLIMQSSNHVTSSKLGLPTFGDIVPQENISMITALSRHFKIFTIGSNYSTDFVLLYSVGAKNNGNTRFSANNLYSKMTTPNTYQNWFQNMSYNERSNSLMPVQYFLMYLNSVNSHFREGDKSYSHMSKADWFIPECDQLLVLIKTLIINFNVNRETSIPHNLPYFDCEGGLNESQYEKYKIWWNEKQRKETEKINNAIKAWSTCTPTGPIDMFGQIVDGSGSATVPGYGSSPFGKTGGMADSIGQLSFY